MTRKFTPPTIEEIESYCRERGNSVDAEEFFHYYDSQDWKKANGRPLSKWKGAIVTWEKKRKQEPKTQPATTEDWRQAYARVKAAAKQIDLYNEDATRAALNSMTRRERHCLKACGGSSRFKQVTPEGEPALKGSFRDIWNTTEDMET